MIGRQNRFCIYFLQKNIIDLQLGNNAGELWISMSEEVGPKRKNY